MQVYLYFGLRKVYGKDEIAGEERSSSRKEASAVQTSSSKVSTETMIMFRSNFAKQML